MFVLLPFFSTQAQENKAITIPQFTLSSWNSSAYRLEVPETILGDRSGGATDRTGKSFTLSAWINMDKFTNESNNKGNVIMGHGARAHLNYNGSLVLATTTDGTLKIISGSGKALSGDLNATVALNTWTYLTLVYDNSDFSVKVYKDGTLIETRNNGSQLTLFSDNPCIFFVGGAGFSGLCDEMQFYNKALTADEVAQAYNNDPQGVSGLTAWYDFNEIESGTTGTFTNKATDSAHADTKAVFYKLTGGSTNSDGGLISNTGFTETAPALAEGRTIVTTTMYTVTLPETVENGTLTVMNGENALNPGVNEVEEGAELTITATPAADYRLESLTVNDASFESGATYAVNENATIAVSFVEIEKHSVSVNVPDGVEYQVTLNGEPVEDLSSVVVGSELTLTISALPQGKKIASVTLGETPLEANQDGTYTFTVTADATLTITLADVIDYYTATLPQTVENGTLTVMNGETALNPGENAQIAEGTILTITATPAADYRLESLTVNGTPIESGATYAVNENTTIAVSFVEIEKHSVSVNAPEDVEYQVTLNGEPVEDLSSVVVGSELTLTITVPQGKKLVSVTFGDEPLEANEDGTYTFTVTADATITVTLADIVYYSVTLPETVENGTLTVMNGDAALNAGENTQIEEGTTLTITATPNSGYEILSLQVNGTDFNSGDTYVVNQNTTIAVSFQIEGPKAVLVPSLNGDKKYQFRFDDIVLGEHENGVNNSWNGGNVTGTDHRARNFTMSAWVKAVSTEGQILGHGQSLFYGATGTFGVFLDNGRLTLKARAWEDSGSCPGISDVATSATLTTDEWAFISVVVDDTNRTIKLYKNGKLAGTGDLSVITENGVREGHGIGLLQDECVFFVGNGGFSCYVDEVQLWNKALNEKELKESVRGGYTQENMPQELIAYYKVTSESEAELENKGTYGACPAGVVEGTTHREEAPYWADVYTCDFISVQIVAGHTFPTNNLTITQPTEGGSFKVVNAQNEEVTSGPVEQFTALTVVAEPAEGYALSQVLVNGEPNDGTTFVIEDDTEVTVEFVKLVTVSYTETTGGHVEMFIDDAAEASEFGSVMPGSKVTLKVTADEGYRLASLLINNEEKKDALVDNAYTIEAIDGDVTVAATFEEIPYWQVTCMVMGEGTVTITDDESNVYASGSEIIENTFVKLVFNPEEGYKVSEFSDNDGSLLDQISNNVYEVGALTSAHFYYVTFTTSVGIDNESIDAVSIYYNAGMLYANGLNEEATLAIYDLAGKLVKVATEAPVNVSDLANGCYIVKVKMNNAEKVVKFIKR